MKWRNAFYWWRDRLIKCLTLQKLIFDMKTTCYFLEPSSSVPLFYVVDCVFTSPLSLSLRLFVCLCIFSEHHYFPCVCFHYNRHCRVSHLFLCLISLSNRMHAARTEYLQGENMNLFPSFTFAPFCIPTSLCKCMHTISLLHRSDSSFTIQSDHHFQFICTCLQLYIRCIFRPFDAINCRPLHNKLMKF